MGPVQGTITSQDSARRLVSGRKHFAKQRSPEDSDRPGLLVFPPRHRIVGYP